MTCLNALVINNEYYTIMMNKSALYTLPALLLFIFTGCHSLGGDPEESPTLSPESVSNDITLPKIPDSSPRVIDLAIPGTHDSGALRGGLAAQCQDLSISEQLNIGIRAFDLRLVDRYNGSGKMDIYHGIIPQGMELTEDILPVFLDFLKLHPEEYLFLSFRKEDDAKGDTQFRQAYISSLSKALSAKEVRDFLYTGNLTPETTVRDIQGKMVILNRTTVTGEVWAHNFEGFRDNTIFECRLTNPSKPPLCLIVEDQYKVSDIVRMEDKKLAIQASLDLMAKKPDYWSITYLSGSAPAVPLAVARIVNPFALTILSIEKPLPGGIYFMDFAGMPEARGIIRLCEINNSKI